jgi:hypothetical protein
VVSFFPNPDPHLSAPIRGKFLPFRSRAIFGDLGDLVRFSPMEKKIFWMLFIVLGLIMDVALPLWWGLALTLPLAVFCWWVAYRSGWFQ